MDKKELVEKQIEEGQRLVEALDKTRFSVTAALWFLDEYFADWRLLIASPFVKNNGPNAAYRFVQSVVEKASPPVDIPLEAISVLNPDDRLITLLRTALRTGSGISRIRFTRNVINNTLIEDALIFRL